MCVLICLLAHKSVLLSLFVHASVHSSVFQWICLVQQSHQSIYLSICPWMSCPIESSIHLSVHMPTESSVHLSVHIPVDVLSHGVINPSVCPYACGCLAPWSHQSICLSIFLWMSCPMESSIHLSVHICLWVSCPMESSVHLSVHIPVGVLSHGVINPSVCPYACGSLVLWSHQSLCLFMCLWICLVQRSHQSICLFIWLWICLMVCLLVHCWV